jgi:hypothetical protein
MGQAAAVFNLVVDAGGEGFEGVRHRLSAGEDVVHLLGVLVVVAAGVVVPEVDAVRHLVGISEDLGVQLRVADVLCLRRLERGKLDLLLRPMVLDDRAAQPTDEVVRLVGHLGGL